MKKKITLTVQVKIGRKCRAITMQLREPIEALSTGTFHKLYLRPAMTYLEAEIQPPKPKAKAKAKK